MNGPNSGKRKGDGTRGVGTPETPVAGSHDPVQSPRPTSLRNDLLDHLFTSPPSPTSPSTRPILEDRPQKRSSGNSALRRTTKPCVPNDQRGHGRSCPTELLPRPDPDPPVSTTTPPATQPSSLRPPEDKNPRRLLPFPGRDPRPWPLMKTPDFQVPKELHQNVWPSGFTKENPPHSDCDG